MQLPESVPITVKASGPGSSPKIRMSSQAIVWNIDGQTEAVPARIRKMQRHSTSFFGVSKSALNINAISQRGLRRFDPPGLDLGLVVQLSISAMRPNCE